MVSLDSELSRSYPLICLVPRDDGVTAYDARSHFAVNLSASQLKLFLNALCQDSAQGKASRIRTLPNSRRALANLRLLRDRGVFAPGPFSETYTTDYSTLHRTAQAQVANIITRKFCLVVTEECNFRCTYCPYTLASTTRRHTSRKMTLAVVRKAIDQYFARYTSQLECLPVTKRADLIEAVPPHLSWFGGEPFLAFDLLRDSQSYFESLPWSQHGIRNDALCVNTNLSRLNDAICAFLVDNNVLTYVSIDGPESEHDRHRQFRNGRGTFAIVYKHLEQLRQFSPEFVSQRVVIISTLAPDHDKECCAVFLNSLGLSFQQSAMEIPGQVVPNATAELESGLTSNDTKYDKLRRIVATAKSAREPSVRMAVIERLATLTKQAASFLSIRTSMPRDGQTRFPFGMRTCPIGCDEWLVAADGRYHMCHKTDETCDVGDGKRGHSVDKIARTYQRFHGMLNRPQCKACWAVRFCRVCSAPVLQNGAFHGPTFDECECVRREARATFRYFQTLAECPEVFNEVKARVVSPPLGTRCVDVSCV